MNVYCSHIYGEQFVFICFCTWRDMWGRAFGAYHERASRKGARLAKVESHGRQRIVAAFQSQSVHQDRACLCHLSSRRIPSRKLRRLQFAFDARAGMQSHDSRLPPTTHAAPLLVTPPRLTTHLHTSKNPASPAEAGTLHRGHQMLSR